MKPIAGQGSRRRCAGQVLALVCALWALAIHAYGQQSAPVAQASPVKVLLLHSYDASAEWPLRIGEGVLQALREAHIHVDLRQEYLDAFQQFVGGIEQRSVGFAVAVDSRNGIH